MEINNETPRRQNNIVIYNLKADATNSKSKDKEFESIMVEMIDTKWFIPYHNHYRNHHHLYFRSRLHRFAYPDRRSIALYRLIIIS